MNKTKCFITSPKGAYNTENKQRTRYHPVRCFRYSLLPKNEMRCEGRLFFIQCLNKTIYSSL